MSFSIEEYGYNKAEVDAHIAALGSTSDRLVEMYDSLLEEFEAFKNSVIAESDRINRLVSEKDATLESIESRSCHEPAPRGAYPEAIANALVDAEIFATEIRRKAQDESASLIKKAQSEIDELNETRQNVISELARMQDVINEIFSKEKS